MANRKLLGKRTRVALVALAIAAVEVLLYIRLGVRDEWVFVSVGAVVGLYGWVFVIGD